VIDWGNLQIYDEIRGSFPQNERNLVGLKLR